MKWLNIGTNIAAIITALIALFTLIQIQKQNTFAHRADIVPVMKSPGFTCSYEDSDTVDLEFISYDELDKDINVILSNIGFGASRENKINWILDREELDDTIMINEQMVDTKAIYDVNDGVKINKTIYYNKDEAYQAFILPVNQEKKETIFKIPRSYVGLWLNALVRVVKLSDDVEKSEKNINHFLKSHGRIFLEIEYEDILRNQYKKKYKIYLHPQYINLQNKVIGILTHITEASKKKKEIEYFIVGEDSELINTTLELN